MKLPFIVTYTLIVSNSSLAKGQKLTSLPGDATSLHLGYKNGQEGPNGKEANLGGWLVLKGASSPNAHFPDLAKLLRENYAQTGYVPQSGCHCIAKPVARNKSERGNSARGGDLPNAGTMWRFRQDTYAFLSQCFFVKEKPAGVDPGGLSCLKSIDCLCAK